MKIMIEVSGGLVNNIIATGECSIYLVDHDEVERGETIADAIEDAKRAFQPDRITSEEGGAETPEFDRCLDEAVAEYKEELVN
jgi:hypothetical protein